MVTTAETPIANHPDPGSLPGGHAEPLQMPASRDPGATTVFDIGMHKGQDTAYYLAKGHQVVAFEADPRLVAQGERRFADAIAHGQLRIVSGAIAPASRGDSIVLYTNRSSVWNTIDAGWAARRGADGAVTVPRVDMLDAFRAFGVPHLIKIDIEGVDRHVLDILHALDRPPRHISIESEKRDWDQLVAELRVLSTLGYRHFRAVQQEWIHRTPREIRTLAGGRRPYLFDPGASGPFGDDLAQAWKSVAEVERDYRRIFRRYRYLGDDALIRKAPSGGKAISLLNRVVGHPLVGWYDTHATY